MSNSHEFSFDILKARQREIRDGFPESLGLRTHRALSWLKRAEQEAEDDDACFIFLWIAFNAAYAQEISNVEDLSEHRVQVDFLQRLIDCDQQQLLYTLVWDQYSGPIRLLIDNRYVFQPFWRFQLGQLEEAKWQQLFDGSKKSAHKALREIDTRKILAVMFDRLYVLRNQLMHDGATWGSGVNRSQVKDGANILGQVVPVIIHLMMEHPKKDWGEPCYPVVEVVS
jgi:hypothetical protein